ncbi:MULTISPECIES: MurR/RpiR family transcriptional regulator [unclassified Devosia]|uniref:MurR/RpiR family transcriptional regulator n=2 Tax=Devosia TaxID=46913 RepID=UPI000ABD6AA1|nr:MULTISPECIES: MurR/RpiR family transcriptional regulator [unclassified Devosia]MBN9362002.1 MurR/RpiR family transcriptional regulator [Devosia sp.]
MDDGDIKLDDAVPRDFPALRALIAARAPTLPRRLTQVASFALDNPDDIAFGTAASVAQRSGVQPSTLVRFSQALGYQGFSDLQEVFRARLRDRVPSYEERLKQLREHGGSSKSGLLLQGFADAAERSVADLRLKLAPEALDTAVEILAKAETIYLVGLRRSFPITSYMAYAMGKLGIRNLLVDGIAGLGAEQIGFISPRDAVLAISFTPYASETVSLVHAAKARHAKVVSITDSIFSPIAPTADTWLEIVEADFEGFRSMAATMALAMTLTVAVASRRGEK